MDYKKLKINMRRIEPKEGIEIFVNKACHISLKQESLYDREENLIVIHREDVPLFIEHLQAVYQEALECKPNLDSEDEN